MEFMRVRVLVDISKPLRRVVNTVDSNGKELMCLLIYERLPVFCYVCGLVGNSTIKCARYVKDMNTKEYPFGNWMRVKLTPTGMGGGQWRNGIEVINNSQIKQDPERNINPEGNEG